MLWTTLLYDEQLKKLVAEEMQSTLDTGEWKLDASIAHECKQRKLFFSETAEEILERFLQNQVHGVESVLLLMDDQYRYDWIHSKLNCKDLGTMDGNALMLLFMEWIKSNQYTPTIEDMNNLSRFFMQSSTARKTIGTQVFPLLLQSSERARVAHHIWNLFVDIFEHRLELDAGMVGELAGYLCRYFDVFMESSQPIMNIKNEPMLYRLIQWGFHQQGSTAKYSYFLLKQVVFSKVESELDDIVGNVEDWNSFFHVYDVLQEQYTHLIAPQLQLMTTLALRLHSSWFLLLLRLAMQHSVAAIRKLVFDTLFAIQDPNILKHIGNDLEFAKSMRKFM
jgi:hypothetical protein